MIGILGKLLPPDEARARRALAAVPYPSPDVTIRRIGDCLLGIATRPDFVDEWLSAGGEMMAAFSGRLDNAAELHRELVRAGTPPASPADADIVVAAFRAWGSECPNRFRGAFCAIVTDGRTMYCFRDHVGFKSMFFREAPEAFVASTETRPVAIGSGIEVEPEMRLVEGIVFSRVPSNAMTAIKGVVRLSQGSVMTVSAAHGAKGRRYWIPWDLLEAARLSETDARDRFLELLAQATARSMTGEDVVFLSGGLDSPAIAAYAAPEHRRRTGHALGAMSAVFPELPDVDESQFVRIAADRFGMALHTFRPKARFLDDAEAWSVRFASPVRTISVPEVWDTYTMARQHGYRNILTGEFAELTYGKFPHVLSHLLSHGRIGTLLRMIRSEHVRGASRRELLLDALMALVPGRLINWKLARGAVHHSLQVPEFLPELRARPRVPRPDYLPPARRRWGYMQLWGTEGSTQTMEADTITANLAGVRVRRPFADIDLWEFFLSLPAELKFPTLEWKSLAKRALRGVIPDEILDRPRKVVFDAHIMTQVDYPALERLLVSPAHPISGVDYARIARDIQGRNVAFHEWIRLRELASCHAFLNAFERE